ncbi:MAG: RNA-guided pseudouridylation complex pseudouridine synthase subunit Cbf5 [Candidatus Woesearchaeota archaeon]|nr:RNA-guided pseudouridylation complex pseudouridine synthase subunit Cbf5 [Candidatus Woesearchaeota archaeon]
MINKLPFELIEYKILIKKPSETSEKYGCAPEERKTEDIIEYGIINLDKPKGPTSHQVSAYVQKILGISKSGHSGTLDPAVTGILPVALGRATRIVQTLLPAGKEYICLMHIHKQIEEKLLRKVLDDFLGKIRQLPPIKSAVKRVERTREIYYLEILEIQDQDVLFIVGCQAGTYIRKLCDDIGKKLGCGAHMAELRRTKAGPFKEDESLSTLHDLTDAFYYYKNDGNDKFIRKIILTIEHAVSHIPQAWVLDTTVDSLCHGSDLKIPGISKLNDQIIFSDMVAVMTLKNELVAIGTAKMNSEEIMKKDKGVAVKIEKVFMQPGTYPRIS